MDEVQAKARLKVEYLRDCAKLLRIQQKLRQEWAASVSRVEVGQVKPGSLHSFQIVADKRIFKNEAINAFWLSKRERETSLSLYSELDLFVSFSVNSAGKQIRALYRFIVLSQS